MYFKRYYYIILREIRYIANLWPLERGCFRSVSLFVLPSMALFAGSNFWPYTCTKYSDHFWYAYFFGQALSALITLWPWSWRCGPGWLGRTPVTVSHLLLLLLMLPPKPNLSSTCLHRTTNNTLRYIINHWYHRMYMLSAFISLTLNVWGVSLSKFTVSQVRYVTLTM